MQKSFYYLVPCSRSARLVRKFRRHGIPFDIEAIRNNDDVRFVFPDLPVRQYHFVHMVFGHSGFTYPAPGEKKLIVAQNVQQPLR